MTSEELNEQIGLLADDLRGDNEWESAPDGEERIKQLIRDVIDNVKPHKLDLPELSHTDDQTIQCAQTNGRNHAIDELEANCKRLGL